MSVVLATATVTAVRAAVRAAWSWGSMVLFPTPKNYARTTYTLTWASPLIAYNTLGDYTLTSTYLDTYIKED